KLVSLRGNRIIGGRENHAQYGLGGGGQRRSERGGCGGLQEAAAGIVGHDQEPRSGLSIRQDGSPRADRMGPNAADFTVTAACSPMAMRFGVGLTAVLESLFPRYLPKSSREFSRSY